MFKYYFLISECDILLVSWKILRVKYISYDT